MHTIASKNKGSLYGSYRHHLFQRLHQHSDPELRGTVRAVPDAVSGVKCSSYADPQYSVLFLERSLLPENLFGAVPFTGLPKLFTPLSTLSLEVSGIVQTQNLYGGGYTGKNVIFGFLDTGIDYRHPAFLHANGQSRILAVWDQTDRTGTPPAQFPYGSLYTKSNLDAALESGNPLSLVPVTDPDGHGTYVAGVAGGTPDASAGFLGAAPEADFAVVKLKPAKQNLKDFLSCVLQCSRLRGR